jgi:hypothetical protein
VNIGINVLSYGAEWAKGKKKRKLIRSFNQRKINKNNVKHWHTLSRGILFIYLFPLHRRGMHFIFPNYPPLFSILFM